MAFLYHVRTNSYFTLKESFLIGRTTGDAVFGDDGMLSGQHLEIQIYDKGDIKEIFAFDKGSKNRSRIDNVEIFPHKKAILHQHSVIQAGEQIFIFSYTKNLSAAEVKTILEDNNGRPFVTLEKVALFQKVFSGKRVEINQLESKKTAMTKELTEKKERLAHAQKEAASLTENLKLEIEKMERMAAEKKTQLAQLQATLNTELVVLNENLKRLTIELNSKKEKVGDKTMTSIHTMYADSED